MTKNAQKINYTKLCSPNNWNDWEYYSTSDKLDKPSKKSTVESNFTNSNTNRLNTNLNDKKCGKNIYNLSKMENTNGCTNKDDCLICYNKVEKKTSNVSCKLCKNIVHYECYSKFIEKNNNYINKCCVCSTETLKFDIKRWWKCCW